eukprot:10276367-Alexandrium_andersonii.AAC.1
MAALAPGYMAHLAPEQVPGQTLVADQRRGVAGACGRLAAQCPSMTASTPCDCWLVGRWAQSVYAT